MKRGLILAVIMCVTVVTVPSYAFVNYLFGGASNRGAIGNSALGDIRSWWSGNPVYQFNPFYSAPSKQSPMQAGIPGYGSSRRASGGSAIPQQGTHTSILVGPGGQTGGYGQQQGYYQQQYPQQAYTQQGQQYQMPAQQQYQAPAQQQYQMPAQQQYQMPAQQQYQMPAQQQYQMPAQQQYQMPAQQQYQMPAQQQYQAPAQQQYQYQRPGQGYQGAAQQQTYQGGGIPVHSQSARQAHAPRQ